MIPKCFSNLNEFAVISSVAYDLLSDLICPLRRKNSLILTIFSLTLVRLGSDSTITNSIGLAEKKKNK